MKVYLMDTPCKVCSRSDCPGFGNPGACSGTLETEAHPDPLTEEMLEDIVKYELECFRESKASLPFNGRYLLSMIIEIRELRTLIANMTVFPNPCGPTCRGWVCSNSHEPVKEEELCQFPSCGQTFAQHTPYHKNHAFHPPQSKVTARRNPKDAAYAKARDEKLKTVPGTNQPTRYESPPVVKYRQGTKVGNTLYCNDEFIGSCSTPEVAARLVEDANRGTSQSLTCKSCNGRGWYSPDDGFGAHDKCLPCAGTGYKNDDDFWQKQCEANDRIGYLRGRQEVVVEHARDLLAKTPSIKLGVCTLPPQGWKCSRESGHEGPCAATPKITREEALAWAEKGGPIPEDGILAGMPIKKKEMPDDRFVIRPDIDPNDPKAVKELAGSITDWAMKIRDRFQATLHKPCCRGQGAHDPLCQEGKKSFGQQINEQNESLKKINRYMESRMTCSEHQLDMQWSLLTEQERAEVTRRSGQGSK